ncbi:vasculin-like protein 1 isoform X2 [Ruditapes philippinarum]|uniref:vasculin-like protein 1 isoform X2 n=1 Tax=Ruditapes philippinarum TaxID=129788 RepID=UPI00295BBD38|nr:vasculin-like protein 1 isoform X2 [Ruditapes philippinarum]
MATNNAPKHDFAPAWLKIPNSENSKPPGNKQGETSSEDRFNRNYHREESALSHKHPYDSSRLHRQFSLEHKIDESKRFPSGGSSKFRHHSVDDDYYYTYAPYGYYNGYSYPDKYGMHYSSQPSLLRSGGQRDSKYQHPHARYGAGQGMNVGYPPYYDFIPPYDYYGNEPYYNNYPPGRGGAKRNYYEKEGRSNSKEGKDKDEKKDKDTEKEKPFNDDFPSLNGEEKPSSNQGSSKQMNGTGVWDNPPKGSNGKPGEESNDSSQSKVLRDANIYKNLVPNKGTQPSTPPMDILNTRFVTQPKTLSDKKSHFLKTLRQEDEKLRRSGESEDIVNGVDGLGLHEDDSNLSSSLEAEQRLLREMGWNEADEEDYEITEDDMKEFQNLTKQVQQRNGPLNGMVKAIPKPWSPKHIPVYLPNTHELNDTLSSSDSDSDDADS